MGAAANSSRPAAERAAASDGRPEAAPARAAHLAGSAQAYVRASPGVASVAPPCDRELHGAHTGRGGHVA
eukprot:1119192-Prymnesium_polylepis.1